jgi:hypothetical protein
MQQKLRENNQLHYDEKQELSWKIYVLSNDGVNNRVMEAIKLHDINYGNEISSFLLSLFASLLKRSLIKAVFYSMKLKFLKIFKTNTLISVVSVNFFSISKSSFLVIFSTMVFFQQTSQRQMWSIFQVSETSTDTISSKKHSDRVKHNNQHWKTPPNNFLMEDVRRHCTPLSLKASPNTTSHGNCE